MMWRYTSILLAAALAATAAAKPVPLTVDELEQVRSGSRDRVATYDDAGLYPLMRNAAWWTPGDVAGAMVPDYREVLADPDAHRANLFLIEGQLGARRVVGPLSRSGPWDGRLEQWSILVEKAAGPDQEDIVAVVLLIDPPTGAAAPAIKSRVRLPARFYKVWTARDQSGVDTEYPVFVGRTVASAGPAAQGSPSTSPTGAIVPLLLLLLVAAVGYTLLKKSVRAKTTEFQKRVQERRARRESQEEPADENDIGPPLPENPADALDELERRRKLREEEEEK